MAIKLTLPRRIVQPDYAGYTDYDMKLVQVSQGQWPAFRALSIDLGKLMMSLRIGAGGLGLSTGRGCAGTTTTIGSSFSKSW